MKINCGNLQMRKYLEPGFIYGVVLIILFTLFSSVYVRSVIMPQQAWWQYYAWRMQEGDILYKDIYLFMPPYYVFLTRILYAIFKENFILYTVFVGYPIKVACLLIMYKVMCKFAKPQHSCIAVLVGACISATYLTDLWYDYNPVLMLPALLLAWFLMRFYEARENTNNKLQAYSLGIGLLVAIQLMSKQSYGLGFFVLSVLMLVIMHWKEKIPGMRRTMVMFSLGFFVGLLPGVVYLSYYDCWNEFWQCIFSATAAKGGTEGMVSHLISIFSSWKLWVVAGLAFLIVVICRYLWNGKESLSFVDCNITLESRAYNRSVAGLMLSVFGLGGSVVYVFSEYMVSAVMIARSQMKWTVAAGIAMMLLCSILVMNESSKSVLAKYHKFNWAIMAAGVGLAILAWSSFPVVMHQRLYEQLQYLRLRRLCMDTLCYMFLLLWLRELYRYFILKTKDDYSVLMFATVICFHMGITAVGTATFEELFMVLYVPWGIAVILQTSIPYRKVKDCVVYMLAVSCILLSVSCKVYIPYEWQGWRAPSIDEEQVACDVSGLEGHVVSKEVNEAWRTVVETIEKNTTEEDSVFQFGNIPLFNVLTERKSPVYAPIGWFDVCPDEIAEKDTDYLYENWPKAVIWHNMGQDEWNLLEYVYRNGNRSGQRGFLSFYMEIVQKNYTLETELYNYRDGTIQVWIRNDE